MFSDVYGSPITARKTNHPHAKPVEWLAYLMSVVGAKSVFDPFAGSGAASIAGIECGVRVVAFEIDRATQREANVRIIRHRNHDDSQVLRLNI